ncbi:hypothetical protein [Streptomyces phaeochromogenes]|uniref:hypothetical protein n=1 Tax=Streptomyces phaeochromogenes TaxID=1923 RepID=UPI0036B0C41C
MRSIPLEAAAGKELTKGGPGDLVDLASLLSAGTYGLVVAKSGWETRVRDASRSVVLGDAPVSLVPGPDGTVTPVHTLEPSPRAGR